MNDFDFFYYMKILHTRLEKRKISHSKYKKLLSLLFQWEAHKAELYDYY